MMLNGKKVHLPDAFSKISEEASFAALCGDSLKDVLTGKRSPLELLFPNGSPEAIEGIYARSPVAAFFNELAACVVGAALDSLCPDDRPIRILEIGGGTGATTSAVLPALKKRHVEYVFSDLSDVFLARARAKFSSHSFMQYQVFDVEKDPAIQGISLGSVDMILAANVLHATADLRHTLRHVHQLLKPEGLLVLMELTQPHIWLDLIFGLTQGWWSFKDHDLRSDYPLLTADKWATLLSESGFRATCLPAQADREMQSSDQALFVAQAVSTVSDSLHQVDIAERNVPQKLEASIQTSDYPNPDKNTGLSANTETIEKDQKLYYSEQQKQQQLEQWLVEEIAAIANIPIDSIILDEPFSMYGLDSIMAIELAGRLEKKFNKKLSPVLTYDYPNIRELSGYLVATNVSIAVNTDSRSADPVSPVATSDSIEVNTDSRSADPVSMVATNDSVEVNTDSCSADPVSLVTTNDPIVNTNSRFAGPVSVTGANQPIAIVGMACRFPGAENLEAYWDLLENGVDAVRRAPNQRFDNNDKAALTGGFIEQPIDEFDANFFGIAPNEASAMDPQQRLMMEVAWEALEHAGICLPDIKGRSAGIFLGVSSFDYALNGLVTGSPSTAYLGTGMSHSIVANRLSYFLDSKGPSLAIDTACSSSLVAVHYACQSLNNGESELAVAGGVNLLLSADMSEIFGQANMLAEDARCKTFDAKANGYVRGEGCGVVILKRYQEALRDGDNIVALIPGSAVNQDGRSHGLTAPHGPSQQSVVKQALNNAGLKPSQINYIEAHGTGTKLGDPIELNALAGVFIPERKPDNPIFVGSAKTNIGHLEAASGIAGLIKTALSLHHGKIAAHLHFQQLNPEVQPQNTAIQIPQQTQFWPQHDGPRGAGVSSFGFGGTNAHIVLQENLVPKPQCAATTATFPHDDALLLPFSAKSPQALKALAAQYVDYFSRKSELNWQDVARTLAQHRNHFDYRLALVARGPQSSIKEQVIRKLEDFQNGKNVPSLVHSDARAKGQRKIAFLFTGQGSQFLGMGEVLYQQQKVFREAFDQCRDILSEHLDQDIVEFVQPSSEANKALLARLIDRTDYTQPLIFAFEYALAKLWQSWGIIPKAVFGHSVGEYVAACIAGVLTLQDALRLVAERGRLMQSLPDRGAMAAIFANEQTVVPVADKYSVNIAAVNGPNNVVISGAERAVDAAIKAFKGANIRSEKLRVSQAFHSDLLNPCLDQFRERLGRVTFSAPQLTMISGLTGKVVTYEQLADPEYWCRQTIEAVRFADAMHYMVDEEAVSVFVEIGAKPVLVNMGRQCELSNTPSGSSSQPLVWLPSSIAMEKNLSQLMLTLGHFYVLGETIDWDNVWQEKHPNYIKVQLPSYPFQRQRYWLDAKQKNSVKTPQQQTFSNTAGASAKSPLIETLLQQQFDAIAQQNALMQQYINGSASKRNGLHTHSKESATDSMPNKKTV